MAKKNKKNVSDKKQKRSSVTPTKKKVLVKTSASNTSTLTKTTQRELVFNKENFKWVGIGLGLITIGMLLMLGGFNENPATWDEDVIYSFRRITLAPIFILAGLAVEIYAIFK